MVYTQNFHRNWRLYISSAEIGEINITPSEFPQGSRVNNNLPIGTISENYKNNNYLEERFHFIGNSYANVWFIDVTELCVDKQLCEMNENGTYDLELVLEFWPQKYMYLGYIISGISYLMVIGYFVLVFVRKTKENVSISKQ